MTTLTAAMKQLIFGDIQGDFGQFEHLMTIGRGRIRLDMPATKGTTVIGQTANDRIRVFQCTQWSAVPCVAWLSASLISATRAFNFCRSARA